MPIRPENAHRYPKDWKQISQRIRDRAGNKCEECGVPNGKWIIRRDGGKWDITDQKLYPGVKIVLTCAHLDHTPEHCADDNLKALCQLCHNRYDAPTRRRGIEERAKAGRAIGDLFSGK